MKVFEFLRNNSIEDLRTQFAITANYHKSEDLVILNYDQWKSPKQHDISRECRALIIRPSDNAFIARSFRRFCNLGQFPGEEASFDWSKANITPKHDGSLIILYWYAQHWRCNTSNSFGDGTLPFDKKRTFEQGVLEALGLSRLDELDTYLNRDVTYICEYCGPYNKVVHGYALPEIYLLTTFVKTTEVPGIYAPRLFKELPSCSVSSIDDIMEYVNEITDTFEGYVLRDSNGMRFKLKSKLYLELHRSFGANYHPTIENCIDYILSGETWSVLLYYPEYQTVFDGFLANVANLRYEVNQAMSITSGCANRKEFALSVKHLDIAPILFKIEDGAAFEECSKQIVSILNRRYNDVTPY